MAGQPLIAGADMALTIRPARAGDAPRLADLCGQLWYPTTVEQVEQRLAQIQAGDHRCVYVAEVDGAVAGWIYVYAVHSLLDDPHAEVGGLIVDEACRGQRIGERLLRQAEQWAADRGCCAVSVRSNVIRTDAHRFYQRLGYRVVKSQLALRRDLHKS